MLVLLSPAKKQDYDTKHPELSGSKPQLQKEIATLIGCLKPMKKSEITKLMGVSEKIADLNHHRFQQFNPKAYNRSNAKQAVFAFKGDAYRALDVETLPEKAITFMQEHLLILSGLYGYLRPLDLIQPYRLEMKTPLKNPRGKDLYAFWGDLITKGINKQLKTHNNKTVINLASAEYFSAINQDLIDGKILTIQFKEKKGNVYKVIGINAKRARGMMTRYIMENELKTPKKIQQFSEANYQFNTTLSNAETWVFTR